LTEDDGDPALQDRIYLIVFEMWRRFIPESLCLSIFCDELDHRIYLYDNELSSSDEGVQDYLERLANILQENTDSGHEPVESFKVISSICANNLETFLFDFVSEQIDTDRFSYASELVDIFYDYISEVQWFDLLRARLLIDSDQEGACELIREILDEEELDLEFLFEAVSVVITGNDAALVRRMIHLISTRIVTEEDFQDLLSVSSDYFQIADRDANVVEIEEIIRNRKSREPSEKVKNDDHDLLKLLTLFELKK
jgi:hypothetical protein